VELTISVEGENAVTEAADLQRWIARKRIRDVRAIQKSDPPKQGEQGATLLAVLGVVLGAQATIELVRSIHAWIETKRRTLKVTVATNGQSIIIEANNPQDIDSLVAQAKGILSP
jgi:hypothetical protein